MTETITASATGPTGVTFQSGPTGTTATEGVENSLNSPLPQGEDGEAEGWRIKVVDFNPNATDIVEQANQFNAPPRKGTYAVVTVRFTRVEGGSGDVWFDTEASLVVRGQSYPESDEA